jgi:hypothetical protein
LSGNTGAGNGYGAFHDFGYNLSSDGTIALGSTSLKNKSAKLSALADNGGPTWTMTLQPGSPAANSGDMTGAPSFDQRGFPRPGAGKPRPDIGALEMQMPTITNEPASQTVVLGTTVNFSVKAAGDAPLSYSWTRNGANLSGTNSTYTISNVTSAAAGSYVAIVSNAVGRTESAPAVLTVVEPLKITNQPASQTVAVGSNAFFSVSAVGDSPLSVQWRSNGVSYAAWTNWTLTLHNVQVSFSADYTARVTNAFGAVTSSVARLTVVSPPSMASGINPSDTNFILSFPTQTGLTYVVEYKDALFTPDWTPLQTNTGTGGSITNLEPATNIPGRFYRVKAQ